MGSLETSFASQIDPVCQRIIELGGRKKLQRGSGLSFLLEKERQIQKDKGSAQGYTAC